MTNPDQEPRLYPDAYLYDEEIARAFWDNDELDNLIVYALPVRFQYLYKHRWKCQTEANYEDIEQELVLATIKAINTYKPVVTKKDGTVVTVKILTHLYNYYRYQMLPFNRDENDWTYHNDQFNEESQYTYEDEVSDTPIKALKSI